MMFPWSTVSIWVKFEIHIAYMVESAQGFDLSFAVFPNHHSLDSVRGAIRPMHSFVDEPRAASAEKAPVFVPIIRGKEIDPISVSLGTKIVSIFNTESPNITEIVGLVVPSGVQGCFARRKADYEDEVQSTFDETPVLEDAALFGLQFLVADSDGISVGWQLVSGNHQGAAVEVVLDVKVAVQRPGGVVFGAWNHDDVVFGKVSEGEFARRWFLS